VNSGLTNIQHSRRRCDAGNETAATGRKEQAIAHLRRAIELSERTRSFLEGDSDLDPLRQDPAFKELLAR
jgi:hypothetical protein